MEITKITVSAKFGNCKEHEAVLSKCTFKIEEGGLIFADSGLFA